MDYTGIITVEPGKRSGQPCIRGLRITVDDVLGYLAAGMTEAELLADFPDLTETDIREYLSPALFAVTLPTHALRQNVHRRALLAGREVVPFIELVEGSS